ncbi:acyl-CoA dehydrogenase family protein [Kibdelosporangium phytohabitans]|uniref:Acyl-CoA dehydrogenase n=1 Tax=Kibdelosporangium phytohabitans TaxID=860235 RepID=A0A0N9I8D5_9PSEU|nr:acyl-CoA dehydrogenase family protein [Kibdelosporangium phytohabitans]ALG12171.1 hypothetical protein AOZ06_39695 [Kibdelosporangium phytohabitans]MBE1463698.1 alkylation response protein AidB-like acyl-CoA dehydrogenase [Kibdelosporangium phytohabitans]
MSADVSRGRADAQIDWLRQYAATRINSRLIDERRCIPPYVALDFANEGLFGLLIEERFGGQAMHMADIARVLEQLAAVDLGLATWVLTSVFPGTRPVAQWATEEFKQEWLPQLAAGRVYGAYAQTEPDAGSDFTSIGTTATPARGGGWRVTGHKHWIGNGSWAGVVSVISQLADPDGGSGGIGAFAIPMSAGGIRPGAEHLSMGLRGMVQTGLHLDGVPVNAVNVLGEEGQGAVVAVDSMTMTRFAIAAASLGAIKRVLRLAHRFGTRRKVAGGTLAGHGNVLATLGELAACAQAGEAIVYWLAAQLDDGHPVEMEPMVAAKVLLTEWLGRAVDSLVQLYGGRGYDEENLAAQLYRDARVYRIFEGASEALVDFLGARVTTQGERVGDLLRDAGAADVGDRLGVAVAELKARPASPLGDHAAKDARKALAGKAFTWAFAVAAVRARGGGQQWALEFVEQRFEQALAACGTELTIASPEELEHIVAGYADRIGDVEQSLPGARIGLDSLLRVRAHQG